MPVKSILGLCRNQINCLRLARALFWGSRLHVQPRPIVKSAPICEICHTEVRTDYFMVIHSGLAWLHVIEQ